MLQPARVLPSNAPPLQDGDNVHQTSRVLQEHSGNRQLHESSFGDDHEQKYPASILSENNHRYQGQQQQQLQHQHHYEHLYHPQPQHRQAWRYGYGYARGGYRYPNPEKETWIRSEADRLYTRFQKSDQYIKYRQRQTKDDKGNGDQKWPDHLERAFFRALVEHPPMGRRKLFLKEKQRGRNELIADCIEEHTGEARNRKQVSSHIQVLKPFVENDPLILKYLSKEDMGAHGGGRFHRNASIYNSGRRMSNYPVTAPPQSVCIGVPPLPRVDPYGLQKLKAGFEVFEPNDFQMFVQRNYKVSEEQEETHRLHTYTQAACNPRGEDLRIGDWQTITRDFPLLAAMHGQRPLDCNVLVAEASLAFPMETWKEKDVELGIYFLCSSQHFPPTTVPPSAKDPSKLIVNNTFYENGTYAKDHSGASEITRWVPSERGSGVDTQIKFGSHFWARTLGRLAARLIDRNKDNRDDVASHLRNIVALQEVIALSEQGHERLLVIHWRFRLSSSRRGRASWKKLLLPTQQTDQVSNERVDSVNDYSTQFTDALVSPPDQQPAPQPTLQSPFEYESSSGSGLSSATWPSSDASFGVPHTDFSAENTFDFNAGNITVSYDPNSTFENFDSSTFNFDTSTDFAADPALQDYSQPWYDSYALGFDGHQGVGEVSNYTTQPEFDNHSQTYGDYNEQYEPNGYVSAHDQQGYIGSHDQQAYGGAGQDLLKDEIALAALADASYIASAMNIKPEQI